MAAVFWTSQESSGLGAFDLEAGAGAVAGGATAACAAGGGVAGGVVDWESIAGVGASGAGVGASGIAVGEEESESAANAAGLAARAAGCVAQERKKRDAARSTNMKLVLRRKPLRK